MKTLVLLTAFLACVGAVCIEAARLNPLVLSNNNNNNNKVSDDMHKLIGTNYKCVNETDSTIHFCLGMSVLPSFEHSTHFEPFGSNYTNVIQFNALSVYDKQRHVMEVYGCVLEQSCATNIFPLDAFSANLVAAPVPVPVSSYFFIGVSIKLAYDVNKRRTIVTGLLPFEPRKPDLKHAFFEVTEDYEPRDLGFTLESIAPKDFFQLGNVEILGTKLSVYDPVGQTFWEGIARNATATKRPEFVMVGIDVDKGLMKAHHTFPIGDCKYLGSMTYDSYSKKILMPTIKTGTNTTIIMGEFDPMTGSCVEKHKMDYLPFSGLLTMDTQHPASAGEPKASVLIGANFEEGSGPLLSEQDYELPEGMVALPTAHPGLLAEVRSVETGERVDIFKGPVPPMPQKVANYDLSTGDITSQTHPICEPNVARNCPWQMYWAT